MKLRCLDLLNVQGLGFMLYEKKVHIRSPFFNPFYLLWPSCKLQHARQMHEAVMFHKQRPLGCVLQKQHRKHQFSLVSAWCGCMNSHVSKLFWCSVLHAGAKLWTLALPKAQVEPFVPLLWVRPNLDLPNVSK